MYHQRDVEMMGLSKFKRGARELMGESGSVLPVDRRYTLGAVGALAPLAAIWSRKLLACVALAVCGGALAQQPLNLADLSAPSFTTFTARDGVPQSVSVSIQTDAEGYVWLASAQGVSRYDGREWTARMPQGTLGTFTLDHSGSLRVAFRDRGIARWDGSAWQTEPHSGDAAADRARRVVETVDAAGNYELWAATFGAGLLKHDGKSWVATSDTAKLPMNITSVARTQHLGGDERLWVGTLTDGLWYRQRGEWQRFQDARFTPFVTEDIHSTGHGDDEALWITTIGDGLWRLDRNGLRHWSVASGELPTNDLYDVALRGRTCGDNALWVASRAGLLRVHDDHVQVFDRRYGLPSNAVRGASVWCSPEGIEVLWLATEAGVARAVLGGGRWQTVSLMGASGTGVFGVLPEADGKGGERLWLASATDGLGLYERGQWRYFSHDNAVLPSNDARMIKRAMDDNGEPALWLGLAGGHLLRVRDGPLFEAVSTPWPAQPADAISDILSRKLDGHIERWVATRKSGIWRWRDGHWTPYLADGSISVASLLEQVDGSGRSWLWASTKQGLARFDGAQWRTAVLPMPDNELYGISLLPDAQQAPVLWIGSRNSGILRVDVRDPANPVLLPADLPKAPDPTAYGAVRDSHGRIYICSNDGVQLLTPRGDAYDSRVFTRRDGLLHDECNSNAQVVDAHDRFWTGMLGGATVFDPAGQVRDATPKSLKLTEVRIDNEAVPANALRIPPGRHELRVDFSLLSWNRENETVFRTQLLGLDAEPTAWSTRNFLILSALPPGDYRLRIEGRDYAGNVSAPIELPIEAAPLWWQRRSAQAAVALALLVLGYALMRWRTRQLLAVRTRLERVVEDRTGELRAANERLHALSYTDALTGLSNRRRLLETLDAMATQSAPAHPTALLFIDVDHFKAYNDQHGHPAGDEALRCVARAMTAMAPTQAVVARYGGEEFACLLPDATLDAARAIAERMRALVQDSDIAVPGTEHRERVTISAGVAGRVLAHERDAHDLLREADQALYQAKRDGRNCVRG